MYQNLANIRAELAQRNPFIMAGLPFGTSGRQQSLTETAAGRRYSTVLENTEVQWATAIHMALVITAKIPGLSPSGISESELLGNFGVSVELAAADPIDDDRKANLGASLYEKRQIDLHTNLTKYQGYTDDKGEEDISEPQAAWPKAEKQVWKTRFHVQHPVHRRGTRPSGQVGRHGQGTRQHNHL